MQSALSLLATCALLLTSSVQPTHAFSRSDYIGYAVNATNVLNYDWYDWNSGQWEGWWHSANALTTIGDLTALDTSAFMGPAKQYAQNTFTAAKASNGGSWLDDFYDDEGWWALAWIRFYDITKNSDYLNAAEAIFKDMETGKGATCGGIWWSKSRDYNAAIANELYLAVAASLGNRVPDKASYYRDIATKQADWFLHSNFINSNNTIDDGLDSDTCKGRGVVFSYNQGVILGGLVELEKLTSKSSYLDAAKKIAYGTINHLTGPHGILRERKYPGPPGVTGSQFKGVFTRNLAYLYHATGDEAFASFLTHNADAILYHDRQDGGLIGPDWQGPWFAANGASQSSGLDCLVAAASVS